MDYIIGEVEEHWTIGVPCYFHRVTAVQVHLVNSDQLELLCEIRAVTYTQMFDTRYEKVPHLQWLYRGASSLAFGGYCFPAQAEVLKKVVVEPLDMRAGGPSVDHLITHHDDLVRLIRARLSDHADAFQRDGIIDSDPQWREQLVRITIPSRSPLIVQAEFRQPEDSLYNVLDFEVSTPLQLWAYVAEKHDLELSTFTAKADLDLHTGDHKTEIHGHGDRNGKKISFVARMTPTLKLGDIYDGSRVGVAIMKHDSHTQVNYIIREERRAEFYSDGYTLRGEFRIQKSMREPKLSGMDSILDDMSAGAAIGMEKFNQMRAAWQMKANQLPPPNTHLDEDYESFRTRENE